MFILEFSCKLLQIAFEDEKLKARSASASNVPLRLRSHTMPRCQLRLISTLSSSLTQAAFGYDPDLAISLAKCLASSCRASTTAFSEIIF